MSFAPRTFTTVMRWSARKDDADGATWICTRAEWIPRGVPQSPQFRIHTDLRPSHPGIFFSRPEILDGRFRGDSVEVGESRVISICLDLVLCARQLGKPIYFLAAMEGRGAVKTLEPFDRGPVASQRKLFREFPR
jgi:hypothetical protein